MSSIIDIIGILSQDKNPKWIKKELMKIDTKDAQEQQIILDLVIWFSENKDDVVELVRILMSLVNPLDTAGSSKKKEARFLFQQILKIVGIKKNIEFYLDIYDSTVEVIIWAKKGGLKEAVKSSSSSCCFPFKKKSK